MVRVRSRNSGNIDTATIIPCTLHLKLYIVLHGYLSGVDPRSWIFDNSDATASAVIYDDIVTDRHIHLIVYIEE